MRANIRALGVILLLLAALHTSFVGAQTPEERTTTPLLYRQAIMSYPACGMWHVSGICFFIICIGPVCKIETSTRYSHMRPDVVVSTWHEDLLHPWPEIGLVYLKVAKQAATRLFNKLAGLDSAGTRTEENRDTKQIRFRDADAIGHPAATTDFGSEMMCKGAAQPYTLYFSSIVDGFSWRNFLPVDLLYPGSWMPGINEVSMTPFKNTWGNVYPRTGWLNQHHDVKLAAVLSQRVADIVTHPSNGHLFQPLPTSMLSQREDQTVFDPPPAMESQLIGGQWQVAAPLAAATPTCHLFGMDDSLTPHEYGDFAATRSESYAYTLWRPYACCKTKGVFLFAIIWGMW